jgi:hypothetical protein
MISVSKAEVWNPAASIMVLPLSERSLLYINIQWETKKETESMEEKQDVLVNS